MNEYAYGTYEELLAAGHTNEEIEEIMNEMNNTEENTMEDELMREEMKNWLDELVDTVKKLDALCNDTANVRSDNILIYHEHNFTMTWVDGEPVCYGLYELAAAVHAEIKVLEYDNTDVGGNKGKYATFTYRDYKFITYNIH